MRRRAAGCTDRSAVGLEPADAYALQQDNIARHLAACATVVGYKVGLTTAAMQQLRLLGVDKPDFGHLLDDMVHRDGGTVTTARYCRPRVEPEICFHLAEPLCGPDVTIEDGGVRRFRFRRVAR